METNQNSNGNANYKQLGLIWGPKTSKAGKQYYSGVINLKEVGFDKDIPVVIFQNTRQRPDKKDADLQIFLSTPRDGQAAATPKPAVATPVAPEMSSQDDTDVL